MKTRKICERILDVGGCSFFGTCIYCPLDDKCQGPKHAVIHAQAWLEANPKKEKNIVPAKPAWDGEFIPGQYYVSGEGIIVLCLEGTPLSMFFYGVDINSQEPFEESNECLLKAVFKPCKVKIEVLHD